MFRPWASHASGGAASACHPRRRGRASTTQWEPRAPEFKPEERLRGLKPDDLAHALKPEDRLVGLSEVEQVLALPPHLLGALSDEYIASLPANVQATVRARSGR